MQRVFLLFGGSYSFPAFARPAGRSATQQVGEAQYVSRRVGSVGPKVFFEGRDTMAKARGSEPRKIADLIQDAIDRGATTVEEIHKSIADLPLRVLEEIDFLRKPMKEVRKVQDRSIGAVYDLIREINRRVGKLAAAMLRSRRASAETRSRPSSARGSRTKR